MILPAEAQPLLDAFSPGLHPAHLPPVRHPASARPSSPPAGAPSPTSSAPPPRSTRATAPPTSGSSPPPSGPPSGWPASSAGSSWPWSPPTSRSSWSATTPSMATPADGLRQGPPPRPGPLQPRLHRLAIRPQVGRPGRAGPLPLGQPTLGLARAGGPVPLRGGRPGAASPPPHPGPDHGHAAAGHPPRFPERRFVFVGDSGYGTHEMARFVHRHRARLGLVSKLHPEANLFEPPPPYSGKGRPPVKGPRRPRPTRGRRRRPTLKRLTVAWYGGGERQVGETTGTGHWYKSGAGLVPIGVGVRAGPQRHASGRVLLQQALLHGVASADRMR